MNLVMNRQFFLNMTSKNGSKELISLLQYVRERKTTEGIADELEEE
ncbi:MAG: hypothetical protein HFH51_11260 [Lachnospiraceae bacterium]|nr:hypothetical protein [Lachnospiraceae bacterium]